MIGKLWRSAGDTRLTFWSLAASAILFFVGSLYANSHFEFFHSLNETRIQDWMAVNLQANLPRTWWLPLLLSALLVLGINTFACTVQRLAVLLPTRKQRPFVAFARDLTPSVIHALFAVVMIGHLITITLGEWRRVPIEEGAVIAFSGRGADLTIESVKNKLLPPVEEQPERIAQTLVRLTSRDGETFELSHGDPLAYGGLHLVLDRKKKKKNIDKDNSDENCNRENDYRLDRKSPPEGLTLLIVRDPGVKVIFPAFIVILILMTWFYLGRSPTRRCSGTGTD